MFEDLVSIHPPVLPSLPTFIWRTILRLWKICNFMPFENCIDDFGPIFGAEVKPSFLKSLQKVNSKWECSFLLKREHFSKFEQNKPVTKVSIFRPSEVKFYKLDTHGLFIYKNGQFACWDLISEPLEHESPPITTRPGTLVSLFTFFLAVFETKLWSDWNQVGSHSTLWSTSTRGLGPDVINNFCVIVALRTF